MFFYNISLFIYTQFIDFINYMNKIILELKIVLNKITKNNFVYNTYFKVLKDEIHIGEKFSSLF